MADNYSGVDLREIERVQNRKLNQLAFVMWTLAMIGLGMLIDSWR